MKNEPGRARMLLTAAALSTGVLLVGEGCIGAAMPKVETKPTTSVIHGELVASRVGTMVELPVGAANPISVGEDLHGAVRGTELALVASLEDDAVGAVAAPAEVGARERVICVMRTVSGNTKAPTQVQKLVCELKS